MSRLACLWQQATGLLPGTAARRGQTADYSAAWTESNERVLETMSDGAPLWIALGDSTSQGIGASSHLSGWVGQTLDLLRAHDDAAWRLVNLSVTGARVRDVLDQQLPMLSRLPQPALVTCAVGANDMLRGRVSQTMRSMTELLDRLPEGAIMATIPQGVRTRSAKQVNHQIRSRCEASSLRLADVWAHTGAPWAGKYFADGFHPNDVGYREWTAAFAESLGLPFSG